MFLASDLGGYAAVVSIWIYTAVLRNGLPRQCDHWLAMTETWIPSHQLPLVPTLRQRHNI
jgi:hypothetical protein